MQKEWLNEILTTSLGLSATMETVYRAWEPEVADEVQEAWEDRVELCAAQAVEASRAFVALLDQACRAQDGEVVAAGCLGDREVERAARLGPVRNLGQRAQDRAAHRVGDRGQGVL